jgi:vacuolar-type H+-ATPase subunit E/Vma4
LKNLDAFGESNFVQLISPTLQQFEETILHLSKQMHEKTLMWSSQSLEQTMQFNVAAKSSFSLMQNELHSLFSSLNQHWESQRLRISELSTLVADFQGEASTKVQSVQESTKKRLLDEENALSRMNEELTENVSALINSFVEQRLESIRSGFQAATASLTNLDQQVTCFGDKLHEGLGSVQKATDVSASKQQQTFDLLQNKLAKSRVELDTFTDSVNTNTSEFASHALELIDSMQATSVELSRNATNIVANASQEKLQFIESQRKRVEVVKCQLGEYSSKVTDFEVACKRDLNQSLPSWKLDVRLTLQFVPLWNT